MECLNEALLKIPVQSEELIQANVKNTYLKNRLEILLNNWCVQKINNEYFFFKHFNGDRKGIIYQLILNGSDYDGVYEFEIFGHDLKFQNVYDSKNNNIILKIKTFSNFDLATFNKKTQKFRVSKNSKNFQQEIEYHISKLYTYDAVIIELKNNHKIINIRQHGELKAKQKLKKLINSFEKDLKGVTFIIKKRQYCVSRIDMGDNAFKNELLKKNIINEKEYKLFTCNNKKVYSLLCDNLKKIEIL